MNFAYTDEWKFIRVYIQDNSEGKYEIFAGGCMPVVWPCNFSGGMEQSNQNRLTKTF